MEDEYEYLDANTESDFKILSSWIFGDLLEVRRTLVTEGPTISSVWENANGEIKMYRTYRRKKPQPDVLLTPDILLTDLGDIVRGILAGVVECKPGTIWLHATDHDTNFIATKLELGAKYRLKPGCKLPPKNTKKLVPRTAEELMKLIGKCLIRMKTTPEIVHLLIDNDYDGDQEHWEMCYIGECVWMPMMKEVEVEE